MYFLKNSKKNQENYFYKIKFSKKVHGYHVLFQKNSKIKQIHRQNQFFF